MIKYWIPKYRVEFSDGSTFTTNLLDRAYQIFKICASARLIKIDEYGSYVMYYKEGNK